MKVLIGVDNSTYSTCLTQAVLTQFQPTTTEVRVLHVLQPIAIASPFEMAPAYAPELEVLKEASTELVERPARELRHAGFKVETSVEIGDVRETLIDSASEWNADLILVGSHGHRGIQRFLLGSVAEFVSRHAQCSVEIVRSKPIK
jgi:nucleotide-binding universal stress UspA family protein